MQQHIEYRTSQAPAGLLLVHSQRGPFYHTRVRHRTMQRQATLLAVTKVSACRGKTTVPILIGRSPARSTNRAFPNTSRAVASSAAVSTSPTRQPSAHSSKDSRNASPSARKRRYGTIISITIFLSLGYAFGRTFSLLLIPPPLPGVGSAEDEAYLQRLNVEGEQLPVVQELRAHPEEWQELSIDIKGAASESIPSGQSMLSSRKLTQLHGSELLRSIWGSFGIGWYRVFWNAKEHRIVTIVHLGVSLSGWPSIVHGGCLATLLQENMESLMQLIRDAMATQPNQVLTHEHSYLRSMQLKYKRPTHSDRFYIIRTESSSSNQQHQYTIKSHIEDAHSGLITAEAVGKTVP